MRDLRIPEGLVSDEQYEHTVRILEELRSIGLDELLPDKFDTVMRTVVRLATFDRLTKEVKGAMFL